ncbi:nitrate reductase molybdenum cofactor assembly chaperone [Demequina globuliformis]|uniref:nitrate reductase molybdenum cofactor assembly chaperone n=1 Tax=Demequina globuliformis TaxID=676202 RepID=UPI0007837AF1|nr:nitrate reductase molybdenum cofactor assembly chaperone [Demequina globuliformis]
MTENIAAARLAAAWLLCYPDDDLWERLDEIEAVCRQAPTAVSGPLLTFIAHLRAEGLGPVQRHYVSTIDTKRRACPYLSYWTDGDTRNRGLALLRFKQAYLRHGWELGPEELPDHLAVVLEFTARGDQLTGEALLVEHRVSIGLFREALDKYHSPYASVVDAMLATLPPITDEIRERMQSLARMGAPQETVGLDPFSQTLALEPSGGRR